MLRGTKSSPWVFLSAKESRVQTRAAQSDPSITRAFHGSSHHGAVQHEYVLYLKIRLREATLPMLYTLVYNLDLLG